GRTGVPGFVSPDGRWVATVGRAGSQAVVDTATGKTVWTEPVTELSFVQFTADGRTLVALEGPADRRRLTVRDAATGRRLREVAAPSDHPLFFLAPDGRRA